MANLELSQHSDYLSKGFAFAFKDETGQPTNTAEQKDAQEYLNFLFGRLETALKDTSRKHLISSIFGLKHCSQLVCKECGKVKNRIEDGLNLSLTVKDIKGVYASLDKQVEGEVISDYECSGCKKKVDIHKRTLLAETPNVLIVHLQRIIFDFNTFQNEKMNQFFEFPTDLDLRPYSYHSVMGKEGKLGQSKKKEADEHEEGNKLEETEAKEEGEGEAEEEDVEPDDDDCWEYTLAGVTVHSGTANAGHYWSYISTERDGLRPKGAEAIDQSSAKWMEFNDSYVRDWELSKLKKEAYGGDQSSSWNTGSVGFSTLDGWGSMGGGGSYGQSGYMLVYERKLKKPLKLVRKLPNPDPEEAKEEGKETVDEIYEIDYHDCVEPDDKPNQIFEAIQQQNSKFGFEQEIYQPEFFEFLQGIARCVASIDSNSDTVQALRRQAVEVTNKAVLEIYASAANCTKVEELFRSLGELLRADKTLTLHKEFLLQWDEADRFSYLYQLMLDNPETQARVAFGKFMRYLLVTLKMHEADYLGDPEEYIVKGEGDNGATMTMEREKSLAARFLVAGFDLFNTKVAK